MIERVESKNVEDYIITFNWRKAVIKTVVMGAPDDMLYIIVKHT